MLWRYSVMNFVGYQYRHDADLIATAAVSRTGAGGERAEVDDGDVD
jgi:hypothetical protein